MLTCKTRNVQIGQNNNGKDLIVQIKVFIGSRINIQSCLSMLAHLIGE